VVTTSDEGSKAGSEEDEEDQSSSDGSSDGERKQAPRGAYGGYSTANLYSQMTVRLDAALMAFSFHALCCCIVHGSTKGFVSYGGFTHVHTLSV
jgi:hypothetical protein